MSTYFSYLLLQIKKSLYFLAILLSPTIFQFCLTLVTKRQAGDIYVNQTPFICLALIAITFIRIPFSGRFTGATFFAYSILPLMFISFLSLRITFLALGVFEKTKNFQVEDTIMLIASLLYFLLVNASLDITEDKYFSGKISNKDVKELEKPKVFVQVKIPSILSNLLHNKLVKDITYIIIRLLFYTGISILFTYLIQRKFTFESTVPNLFTVFSTIWTVIAFIGELFITRIKREG